MICPICKRPNATAGHILGHATSAAKAKASAVNGRKGGRPKRSFPDENVIGVDLIAPSLYRVETDSAVFEIKCDKPPKVGDKLKIKAP